MKKFQCAHCGQRIAVAGRHLGGLVTCPECGRATHPLAEQIVAAHVDHAPTTPADPPRAACANCGRGIGKLQKLNLWQNDIVCAACYEALAAEAGRAEAARAGAARQARGKAPPAAKVALKDERKPLPGPMTAANRPADALRPDVSAALAASAGLARTAVRALASQSGRLATRSEDASGLRVVPFQLQIRNRILAVLLACCLAGVAIYGALTLLRELAGLLTTLALILLAAVAVYFLIRAAFIAGRAALRKRGIDVSRLAKEEAGSPKDPPAEMDAVVVKKE